ncbi:MAG: DUF4384 domain-containing protein [Acidobacteria bacterium]|nr:DUF4384 domain-containing protein [Acidobacteriota bacterium]
MGSAPCLDMTLRLFASHPAGPLLQVLAWPAAQESPVGIVAEHPVVYQPAPAEIHTARAMVAEAIRSQGVAEEALHAMRCLGDRLRRMLFPPPIWQLFLARLQYAQRQHTRLRLRLLIDPAEMAAWPYEYLYVVEWERDAGLQQQLLRRWGHLGSVMQGADMTGQDRVGRTMQSAFLALNPSIAVTRLGNVSSMSRALAPAEAVRILLVYCNLSQDRPRESAIDWPYLESLPIERKAILQALRPLEAQTPQLVTVDVLENPTPTALLERVPQGYHVVIYLGHGYYNAQGRLGSGLTCGLVLDNGYGHPAYLEAERFAEALTTTTVQLVVFNACETMREDHPRLYRGTAWSLAERGITTIAMHFEQPDAAGLLLGEVFWRAVARHDPIDACLAQAREVLMTILTEDRPDWGNAALILQSPDGVLLAPPRDIERTSYLRVLARRFPGASDDDLAEPVLLLPEVAGAGESLGEILTRHPKLLIQTRELDKLSARLLRWVRTAETRGALQPGTLPLWIRLDRWAISPDNLPNFLSSSLRDLGLSAAFSEVLVQHTRDGSAVLLFQAPEGQTVSSQALGWIADVARGLAHASPCLVLLRHGEAPPILRHAGFTVATLADEQVAAPPLKIRVWVEPMAFSHSRDILVLPSTTRACYRVNDAITVRFWANADCYLTLIDYGTSGRETTIFPNALHRDPAVMGNVTHMIPDPAHPFVFQLSGPPGVERLQAIATRVPVGGGGAAAGSSGGRFAQRAGRDIEVLSHTVQAVNPVDRAEAECEIQVVP